MKSKKVIIAFGIVAALLIIYALASLKDRAPGLPELPRWSEGADEILIEKAGERIRLFKKDGRWLVGEEEYPADAKTAEKMEEKLRDLVISDISSTSPHYDRFELTSESAIHVVAKRQGQVLRDVYFGKRSSKTNHTYIRLTGRDEVFKASGLFSYDFSKKVDDIRDKTILDVKSDDIEALELSYKGVRTMLERVKAPDEKSSENADKKKDEPDKKKAKKEADKWVFANNPQKEVDIAAVNAVINSFGPLRTHSFPAVEKKSLKNPLCTIKLMAAGKTHEISIFNGKDNNEFFCVESASPYAFSLAKYAAERYFRLPKDFEKRP